MSFFTLDIDGLDDADRQLYTLRREIESRREEHWSHARHTRESLDTLRGHNFTGLDSWHIDQIWNDLPFNALSWEFHTAEDAIHAVAQQARYVLDTLIERQQGLLEGPLRDLCDPALLLLDAIAGPLGDLGGWLTLFNLWSLIENPGRIGELLDGAERAFEQELDQLGQVRSTLQGLKQRALLFIQELERPLPEVARDIAAVAGEAITVGQFLRDLKEERSIARVLKDSSPHFGPLDVVVALLGWVADPDHSLHSLAAHLVGAGVEALVDLTVVGGIVDLADSAISLTAHVESWKYDIAGRIEGGRWGARLEQVGGDWERTAGDADAMGDMFTDTGAAIIDMPQNVRWVELAGPPGLAPVAAAAVLGYDELTGQGTQVFNSDAVKFAQDGWHLAHLPLDAAKSVVNSAVVSAGDDAHRLTSFLPQGVRQGVDNRIYDITSWAMIGG